MKLKVYHFENFNEGYLLVAANNISEAHKIVKEKVVGEIMWNVQNTLAIYDTSNPDNEHGCIILNRIK